MYGICGKTRALVKWLRGRGSHLLTSVDLNDWLVKQPSGPWIELLSEAVAEFELETSGAETSVDYLLSGWQSGRGDARRRQRGLLMMTAHRAKGPGIRPCGRAGRRLGPGWTQRRLGCAAPPVLCGHEPAHGRPWPWLAFQGPHRLQDTLADIPSVLRRQTPAELPAAAPELARKYRRLSLRDVFLSFAGYRQSGHPVHRAIASLSPGDRLQVRLGSGRWELLDQGGTVVGTACQQFRGPQWHALLNCHGLGHRHMGPGGL